jgi:hypothetical protein
VIVRVGQVRSGMSIGGNALYRWIGIPLLRWVLVNPLCWRVMAVL